jgi:hypothetical protein
VPIPWRPAELSVGHIMDFRRPNGNLDPAVGGITACGDSDPAPLPVGAADKTVTATAATAVGDIERNRMVDSVRAWVRLTADLWMKADSVGLMEQYLNEDSLARSLRAFQRWPAIPLSTCSMA